MKKTCTRCKKEKLLEEYHKNNEAKDGHHAHCKECRTKYNSIQFQAWRRKNLEKYNAYQKEWIKRKRTAMKLATEGTSNG